MISIEDAGLAEPGESLAQCLLIGFPVAWLLAILPSRQARWLFAVILLSMWTNLLARTYGWMVLLQNRRSTR